MRLLVCGGRDYSDAGKVAEALNAVRRKRGIDVVIHGAARGADTLAAEWAKANGVPDLPFPAQWKKPDGSIDKGAGPKRNRQMLDEGHPDGVVAFPGGSGTADMMKRARAAGLTVWEPCA